MLCLILHVWISIQIFSIYSCVLYLLFQHQQCLAVFSRVKFTRVLLTVLIAFTKKEVRRVYLCVFRSVAVVCTLIRFIYYSCCLDKCGGRSIKANNPSCWPPLCYSTLTFTWHPSSERYHKRRWECLCQMYNCQVIQLNYTCFWRMI